MPMRTIPEADVFFCAEKTRLMQPLNRKHRSVGARNAAHGLMPIIGLQVKLSNRLLLRCCRNWR